MTARTAACGSAEVISCESFDCGGAAYADTAAARTRSKALFIERSILFVVVTPSPRGKGEIVDKKLIGAVAVQSLAQKPTYSGCPVLGRGRWPPLAGSGKANPTWKSGFLCREEKIFPEGTKRPSRRR